MLAAVLMVIVLIPSWSQAQIKLPIYEEEKGEIQKVVFKEATQRGDFQHGKLLRVTLADGDRVLKGVLVRVDPRTGRIFLRTTPGAMPIAISEKEIRKIDKGIIKHEIQEASYKQEDVTLPEIRQFTIYNGMRRTVNYQAPTISPSEIARLAEFEAAENEMLKISFLAEKEKQVLETDMAIQKAQLDNQDIVNNLLYKQTYYSVLPEPNFGGLVTPTFGGATASSMFR